MQATTTSTTNPTNSGRPPPLTMKNFQPGYMATLGAGVCLFVSGGMSFGQSLGWFFVYFNSPFTLHLFYSWFIAVAIGAVLSVLLGYVLPKKFIMAVSAILILVGGITRVSVPTNYSVLIVARYFNGIGLGMATVQYLMYASELSRNTRRGFSLGLEQFCISLGLALQMIMTSQWSLSSSFSQNSLQGIFDIILAAVSMGCLWYFIESPVDYVRLGDDAAALDCLSKLQDTPAITMQTNQRLEELKDYVREENSLSSSEVVLRSLVPLLKMLAFRSMIMSLSYSPVITNALTYTMFVLDVSWTPILAGSLRIFGSGISMAIVDIAGRKLPAIAWALAIGGLIVPIAVILDYFYSIYDSHRMFKVAAFWIAIHVADGLYAPVTSVYLGEAFPLHSKGICIALCVVVEQIIQIVIFVTHPKDEVVIMASGIIILVAAAVFLITMPETKKTSLREAQAGFRKFFNFKMF
ncbi:uncharacterized protein LOC101893033 [Musca domestica]|uniref:D-xylose-proton symporter-like 1 n=1 Tax=Musca domestica TaxID=7370 RepID=A0A1I8MVM8_MUSDO|nr:uncharacterized protein LOC101893033 [Musca domestica]